MKLLPSLVFDGTCEEALEFYKYCLGGQISYLERFSDTPLEVSKKYNDKILHAKFEFGRNAFFASDIHEKKEVLEGDNCVLNIEFTSIEELEEVFSRLAEEAIIKKPLKNTFWGAAFAEVTDKYGIPWCLTFTKISI